MHIIHIVLYMYVLYFNISQLLYLAWFDRRYIYLFTNKINGAISCIKFVALLICEAQQQTCAVAIIKPYSLA